jgi:hypothetical protein
MMSCSPSGQLFRPLAVISATSGAQENLPFSPDAIVSFATQNTMFP